MNKKALFTGAIVLLVMFAVLPEVGAVVEQDPFNSNILKNVCSQKFPNLKPINCNFTVVVSYLETQKNLSELEVGFIADYYIPFTYSNTVGFRVALAKSAKYINKLYAMNPDNPLVYNLLSQYYSIEGNNTESLKMLDKELQLDPSGEIKYDNGNLWQSLEGKLVFTYFPYGAKALEFPEKIYKTGEYKKLKTIKDLKKIGYFKYRKEVLIPIYEGKYQELPTATDTSSINSQEKKIIIEYSVVSIFFILFLYLIAARRR